MKPKICFLITGLQVGGAEKHLLKLIPRLNLENFVISLTDLDRIGQKLEKKGIKVYYLGLWDENKFNFPIVSLRLIKVLLREKPDIIDSYLPHSNIIARIIGKLCGIKKIICSIRNDYSTEKIYNLIDTLTKGLVDLYIPNSKALIPYLNRNNQISLDKIRVLPNGIDLKEIYPIKSTSTDIRKELDLKANDFILISVARLVKNKNLSTLIRAMKLVKSDVYLIIIGIGRLYNYLNSLKNELGVSNRIIFLGLRKDIYSIVNQSNVFILPSLKEGMSNALLEAMALKKLCLVSNILPNRVLIKDGYNGFLFDPNNHYELAQKIDYIYENKNFDKLRENAFQTIIENHEIERIVKKYRNIINSLE